MTQEEKARAYDEALERAKNCLKDGTITNVAIGYIEEIFPELAESEDERIRKALIEYFNEQCDMSDWNGVYGYQVVAWLEKQGEQNPTDKVEPKFKESMTDYERGYIDGRKAMAEKIQIILNAI